MVRNNLYHQQHERLSQDGAGRGASQATQPGQIAGVSLSDTVLSQIIKKEAQYCDGIKVNHIQLKSLTQRLCDIQSLLSPNQTDDNKITSTSQSQGPEQQTNDELLHVINEQKETIRNIAKENVQREQYVRTFCDTLQTIRNGKQQKEFSQGLKPDNQTFVLPFDYQTAITDGMDTLLRKRNINLDELIQQERYYRDIADLLGDPKPTSSTTTSNTNKKRHSGGTRNSMNDDEEEDDIEVTATQMTNTAGSTTASISQLKCPITRDFMTDAVENIVCHHLYSRNGILSYIQQQRRNRNMTACPIYGCMNQNVTAEQLQDHHETIMLAKREIRRVDFRKEQQQQSNTVNDTLMDSDDEE